MVGQILQITPEVFSLLQEFTVMRINTRVSRTLKVHDSNNGSEHLSYEESLRKLGMFSPQKRRHRGNVINVYTNQMGGWKEERAMLLSVVTSDRTKAVGINWNIGGFLWMSRNIFFTLRGMSLLGHVQQFSGHDCGQPALAGPAWARGPYGLQRSLPTSTVILWFCEVY